MFSRNHLLLVALGLASVCHPLGALAQEPEAEEGEAAEAEEEAPAPAPAPTVLPDAAPALTDRAAEAVPTEDVTTGSLSAGGALNTGNTSSLALSVGGNLRIVRGRNAFELESTFNLGAADATPDDGNRDYDLNARNWNSRARYDRFFTDYDAAYLSSRHRWDTFAGLDSRLQLQVGYLRNFLKEETHRFWGEVGYDYTWDNIHGPVAPNTANTHSARLFLGYSNSLNEHVEWLANVETLFNFQDIADLRINADSTLRVSVASRLALDLNFKLQFDNVPVEGKRATDTQTTIRLVYTLF